jgi:hypothetical protein
VLPVRSATYHISCITVVHTAHSVTYLRQMMVIAVLEKARPVPDVDAGVDKYVVCCVAGASRVICHKTETDRREVKE